MLGSLLIVNDVSISNGMLEMKHNDGDSEYFTLSLTAGDGNLYIQHFLSLMVSNICNAFSVLSMHANFNDLLQNNKHNDIISHGMMILLDNNDETSRIKPFISNSSFDNDDI